jgi:hypothetical protein
MDIYLELVNSTMSREVFEEKLQNGVVVQRAYRLVLPSAACIQSDDGRRVVNRVPRASAERSPCAHADPSGLRFRSSSTSVHSGPGVSSLPAARLVGRMLRDIDTSHE